MGLLLTASRIYLPQFIQKRKLETLFAATADAFQVSVPLTGGLSLEACLKLYAQFTREQSDKAFQRGNESAIKSRLFRNAYQIGKQLKSDFSINTAEEVMRLSAVLYKILRIEFQGGPQGNIIINSCFFSSCYSDSVCRLISSLDEGLLSGLSGGGKLSFSQRITGGNSCCLAYLEISGILK